MEENKKQEKVTETAPMPAANQSEQPTAESPAAPYVEENVSAVESKPQKIAKMETAEKRINKHLTAQNITPQEGSIRTALIALYERYELNSTVPTQSAFAEACQDQQAGASVLEMQKDPFRPTGKRNALIAAGCAVVAAAVIAGGAFAYSQLTKPAELNHTAPATATVQQKEDGKVSVKVNCDGWNPDTSTPIVVSVYSGDVKDTLTSTDESTVAPDPLFTKEVQAGVETDLDDIKDNGTYTIAVTGSPILDDGTIFDLPEPQVVDFDTAKGASVEITLTPKAADQVTEADIAAAQATAVASGADAEKVTAKASNATNKAATAQGGTVASGTANAATKSNANKTGTTIPSGNNNQQGNTGNQGGNTSGGNTGGNSGSTTPSTPAHQHNYNIPVTKNEVIQHPAETVYHPAQYEVTPIYHYVCACGKEFSSQSAVISHQKSYPHSSEHGSTEVKKVGEETKVVKEAWTETTKAAWNETVTKTIGYKCSCGDVKYN